MSARSLHEIIADAAGQRSRRAPRVRRGSVPKGQLEARFWRPVGKRAMGPALLAAEAYDRMHRQPGRRNGPLGHIGLEVLRALYRIICHRTGRLEPSLEYLMRKLRRSRDAVVRALKALREHGFVEWIRRTEAITDAEGAGPRLRQVSNAYRLLLPPYARALVERVVGPAPAPLDTEARRREHREQAEAMICALSLAEQALARISDPALADALSRLGRAVEGPGSARVRRAI